MVADPVYEQVARDMTSPSAAPPRADLDCLFLHVPKAHNHYLPLGDFMNITYMPLGLPGLAEWLARHGRRAEIVHLGVEWLQDPAYRVVQDFEGAHLGAIGVGLYWHYQAHDAIEVARAMKASHPEAFVFLGGLTASYFAREILEAFEEVDAVVQGHAETAMMPLMEALDAGGGAALGGVPHLLWRDTNGALVDNRRRRAPPAPTTPALDDLVFGDLSLLRHAEVYAATFGFPLAHSLEIGREANRRRQTMGRPFFPLLVGRGCPWSCTFCGGNRDTLARVTGRRGVEWRAPERVIDDISRAAELGYRSMAVCFDPTPAKDGYYVELFDRIRRARLGVDLYFEAWGLPTEAFIRAFRRAFPSPDSYVALSPDAGDERVRRLNKQPFYPDADLYDAVERLDAHGISVDVFYTLGLPGERLPEAMRTRDQMRDLAARFDNIRRCMVWTVQLEPGSPQFERPEAFGMVTDRRTFLDFHRAHGGPRADVYTGLGYKIADYFGDERDRGGVAEFERHLQHLKCLEFCFLGDDPRRFALPDAGRAHCLDRRVELATCRGHGAPARGIGPGHDYFDALAAERALRGPSERFRWV